MSLWRIRDLTSRRVQADYTASEQGRPFVTELLGDGEVIANAIERTPWAGTQVQAVICTHCGFEHCAIGGWVSPRRFADLLVWLPVFDAISSEGDDCNEYAPPPYFTRGMPVFGPLVLPILEQRIGTPIASSPRTSLREVARTMQWLAPGHVLDVPQSFVRLAAEHVLASSTGDRHSLAQELQRLLDHAASTDAAASLRPRREDEEVIELYLDLPGHHAWSPLALVDGRPALHLDGLVVAPIEPATRSADR